MPENLNPTKYERRITHLERYFTWSPFGIVTMVARIQGSVTESMLREAVSQVQLRHALLRVRIREGQDHELWFTSVGVGEIPIEIVPRESGDHWIEAHHRASKIPFEFHARPAIRFILVQSPDVSELIILCHHMICDGMSLAYLARDLMLHLGDPARQVEVLPDPVLMDQDNLPEEVSIGGIVKFFVNRINKQWSEEPVFFDEEDYRDLNEAYWSNFTHRAIPVELSEAQTTALVERCRAESVTVNTTLTVAFVGAQRVVVGDQPYHSRIAIAGSVRDRLRRPAGEAMGYYAGGVTPKFKYNMKKGFWENARGLHRKVQPLYQNKRLFRESLAWCYLEPGIMEAISFKTVGRLVPPHATRYDKLSAFSQRGDVVASAVKREKLDSFDYTLIGTAVTNLTRLDFPRQYGPLELERLIMNPGGAFPLVNVKLVVGAVTCAGKLSLLVEYAEESIDTPTVREVTDQAIEFLLGE
jgi:hypothetical protein